MEEQLISFETAKLAKEKGFKEFSYACYKEDGILENLNNIWHCGCEGGMELDEWFYDYNNYKHKKLISAPTQSLLQKWLRDAHKIHIRIDPQSSRDSLVFYAELFSLKLYNQTFKEFTRLSLPLSGLSYEEALEKGLLAALNKIKLT